VQDGAVTDTAPDGSPVPVYLALPAEPDLGRVRSVVRDGWSVLDLGAGVGRIANPLAADGHAVVAVDDSTAMLEHIHGAETVRADIWTLDLGRQFDAVLAMSHLVNDRVAGRRHQLLRVCRRHLRPGGVVLVTRYPPGWSPSASSNTAGPVQIELHDVRVLADGFAAEVTYALGERSWTQAFDGAVVDDDELAALAAQAGLEVQGALDDDGAWVVLEPSTGA
jgi:SAM-dependent methyltransferase